MWPLWEAGWSSRWFVCLSFSLPASHMCIWLLRMLTRFGERHRADKYSLMVFFRFIAKCCRTVWRLSCDTVCQCIVAVELFLKQNVTVWHHVCFSTEEILMSACKCLVLVKSLRWLQVHCGSCHQACLPRYDAAGDCYLGSSTTLLLMFCGL
jgi:hypothetical protein